MHEFISTRDMQALVDKGLLDTLKAHLKNHEAYTRHRVEQTHLAEGANPDFVKTASLYQLEYGNIGSGIAKPEWLRHTIETLEHYIAGTLYIKALDDKVVHVTENVLDTMRDVSHRRMWSQKIINIIEKTGKNIESYGSCGTLDMLTLEGLDKILGMAEQVPSPDIGYGYGHGYSRAHEDAKNGPFATPRWQILKL